MDWPLKIDCLYDDLITSLNGDKIYPRIFHITENLSVINYRDMPNADYKVTGATIIANGANLGPRFHDVQIQTHAKEGDAYVTFTIPHESIKTYRDTYRPETPCLLHLYDPMVTCYTPPPPPSPSTYTNEWSREEHKNVRTI